MAITGGRSAVFIIAAGMAVGSAGAAWAGGPPGGTPGELSGTYSYRSDTGRLTNWVITPCGPGCADVAVTPVTDPRVNPHGGRAQLIDGQWVLIVQSAQAVRCKPPNDGVTIPGTVTFSLDAAAMSGTAVHTQSEAGCGDPAQATYRGGFTLTKIG
jgi:hypothetical protein